MNLTKVKSVIRENIKMILLIGLFGAVCAAGHKYCFTPSVSVQGNFVYTRIVQVEDVTDYTNPNFEFAYTGLLNTNASFLELIKSTDGEVFDFGKIYSAWSKRDELTKVNWLRSRIRMYNYHDNVFEIVFTVPSANISDLSYLENNTKAFMDAVVANGNALIREVKPHAVIKNVKSDMISPRVIEIDKITIAIKNGIYGLIAGVFLAIAVLLGNSLFKELHE